LSSPDQRSALASDDVHFTSRPAEDQPTAVVPSAAPSVPAAPVAAPAPIGANAAPGGQPLAPQPAPAGPMPPVRPAKKAAARTGGARRARLTLRGINAWSALRFSVVIAIALFCVWMVTIGVLYGVLEGTGAVEKVNEAIVKINPDGPAQVVTAKMVFGGGVIIGAAYMVLFIALATIGSVIYNLCADLVGGVEVTLSERE
jgi:hypothetical protein